MRCLQSSPSHKLYASIGGVVFNVESALPVSPEPPSTPYSSFMGLAGGDPAPSVRVRIFAGDPPDVSDCETIFDSERSWSMLQGNGHRYAVANGPMDRPLWVADIAPSFESVDVTCGEAWTEGRDEAGRIRSPLQYPLDQVLLMYVLSRRRGILVHAAGASVDGKGLLFPGTSGAGKSTISAFLRAGDGIQLLSDDRIVVRGNDSGRFHLSGTPWPGDAGVAENDSASLDRILFLRHGNETTARPMNAAEAVESLMPVISVPWYDREVVPSILATVEELVSLVPAFELSFRPGHEIVGFLREFSDGSDS